MQKTKIEWADYSWNPVKGLCPNACWYCYARAMYKRFKWNPELRLDDIEVCAPHPGERWNSYDQWPDTKAQKVFVGSTIDLFHPSISSSWIQDVLSEIRGRLEVPWTIHHTYIFLTKFPARYAEFDFPKNCWLGTTVTSLRDFERITTLDVLNTQPGSLKHKNLQFCSLEPLLGDVMENAGLRGAWSLMDWIIVGALTGPKARHYEPKRGWIESIVGYAKEHNIPIFLKNNLFPAYPGPLIQEWPAERD